MTFTYNVSDLSSPLAQVRLEIADTDQTTAHFADEEIEAKLDARGGNVLHASADLCDILAVRFARKAKFTTDNQSFDWTGAAKAMSARAAELRSRAAGLVSVGTQRIDGYSEDITSRDVRQSDQNPRGRYRRLGDRPF